MQTQTQLCIILLGMTTWQQHTCTEMRQFDSPYLFVAARTIRNAVSWARGRAEPVPVETVALEWRPLNLKLKAKMN